MDKSIDVHAHAECYVRMAEHLRTLLASGDWQRAWDQCDRLDARTQAIRSQLLPAVATPGSTVEVTDSRGQPWRHAETEPVEMVREVSQCSD